MLANAVRVENYYQTLVYLYIDDIRSFLGKCILGEKKDKRLKLNLYFSRVKELKIFLFVIYLTAAQKKRLLVWPEDQPIFKITLSNTQFYKTCYVSLVINRDIYHLKTRGTLAPKIEEGKYKEEESKKILAIEIGDLIDFDNEVKTSKPKEVTPVSKPKTSKPKRLAITDKPKEVTPVSKPKTSKLDELISKNLINFSSDPFKQYNTKQNKLIRSDILKALLDEINHPLTNDVLGLKLTKRLEKAISKLTNEAAIGLNWIIRALVTNNKGLLPVYIINKKYYQLSKKEIK